MEKKLNGFHVFNIIQSNVPPDNNQGLNFRFWRYATFVVSINGKPENLHEIYANTGYGAFFMDEFFLIEKIPDYQTYVQTKPRVVKIRELKKYFVHYLRINFYQFSCTKATEHQQ